VIEAMDRYYLEARATVHRSTYPLAAEATELFEGARGRIAAFAGSTAGETIFTRNATEAINVVAWSWGRANVGEGDRIALTEMEHHSNIVPWQMLCEEKKARLRVIPINDDGEVIFEEYEKLLNSKTRLVAVTHVSNALGTINPIRRMIAVAHRQQIPVLVDGAQAIPHLSVDVQALDCDFYTFSGHKLYGPTGIGVLYGKASLLEAMSPFQGGGDMIASVTFEKTTYKKFPHMFLAVTPDIAGFIGLGAPIDYVEAIGLAAISAYEDELLAYATREVSKIAGVRILGSAKEKASVLSFTLEGVHPHDIGTILDQQGIAIRAGHHCAQPVMDRFKVPATARASFAFYNTKEEVDALVNGIRAVMEVFN
jgi:cysteine desulfurase/selenocysteine lyase